MYHVIDLLVSLHTKNTPRQIIHTFSDTPVVLHAYEQRIAPICHLTSITTIIIYSSRNAMQYGSETQTHYQKLANLHRRIVCELACFEDSDNNNDPSVVIRPLNLCVLGCTSQWACCIINQNNRPSTCMVSLGDLISLHLLDIRALYKPNILSVRFTLNIFGFVIDADSRQPQDSH